MLKEKKFIHFANDRYGFTMIVSSLFAIGLVITLLFNYQQKSNVAQIRSQGIEFVRIMSEIPYEQLISSEKRRGTLQFMKYNTNSTDFAYGVVVNANGDAIAEVTASGVIAPKLKPPADPSNWLGEKALTLKNSNKKVLEFHAPLLTDGNLQGYVRLGYFKPEFGLSSEQVPFLASVALPIFLIALLFYYLVKREIQPLKQASVEMQQIVESGNIKNIEIHANGELSEFIHQFNSFIKRAQERVHDLESNKADLVTSTKFLTYKQSRIESVLQALPEAVMVFDESGSISFANSKVTALLGVPADQVIDKDPANWCENKKVVSYLKKIKNKPLSNYSRESIEFSPENAPEKTIQLRVYPLFSPKDANLVLGTLVLFEDITEENLARQNRGEFVAHIAHELKTPLNVLAMYAESLQRKEGESKEFRIEAVNVISDEVERLSALINNLLSITKIEMGSMSINRTHVKLRGLLEDAFNNVSRSGQRANIKFQLDLPSEISPQYLDKDLLRIAINNFLTNAIKYNKDGGTVTLSAEETDDKIQIRISDTGIGINSEDQLRIFEKFYRSDATQVRERTGHGLGLALAQDIVHLHHGRVSVESNLDQGTEFIIELQNSSSALEQAV